MPAHVRCDNGPELTANALKDWCRFSHAESAYIDPGSPWQNPFVESFGSRVREELLSQEVFSCLTEARVMIEDWRVDYNEHRPHSSLGMMTPNAFGVGYRSYLSALSNDSRRLYGLAPLEEKLADNISITNQQLSQRVDP